MTNIVRGPEGLYQGVSRKTCGGLSALDIRQHWLPLRVHLNLGYRHGVFCEDNGREIVRRVVDEIDQFWKFRDYEGAEQQTNHNGEGKFDAHDNLSKLGSTFIL